MKHFILILSFIFPVITQAKVPSIGMSEALEYKISKSEKVKSENFDYVYVCASALANSKEERAHTMVKIAIELEKTYKNVRLHIDLAPHKDLCQLGRLIGQTYYSPSGDGWKGLSSRKWTWQILTTGFKVTEGQIADTLVYESNKERFKNKFGQIRYSEELEKFVEKKLGRSPRYVTSGLWVDVFHSE